MKKTVGNKRKLNNAGLTLVEILVAIAILSIAIVPLMYGFVYVAKHNANAKHLQQTSILAHSIIENCKAYSMEEIQDKIVAKTFLPDADDHIDASVIGTNKYVYYFDDVNIYKDNDDASNVSTQVYDVAMTIEPYGAEKTMLSYSDMNKYRDAVFTPDGSLSVGTPVTAKQLEDGLYNCMLDHIVTRLATDTEAVSMTRDEIAESLESGGRNDGLDVLYHRKIIVSATKTSTFEHAEVEYIYTFTFGQEFKYDALVLGVIEERTMDLNVDFPTYEASFPIYHNTDPDSASLENLYLFYYPVYNVNGMNFYNTSSNTWGDIITISNTLGRDLNVYLMKQVRTDMSTLDIKSAENTYKPQVAGTATGTAKIKLYHNLLENMGGGNLVGWSPSDVAVYYAIECMDFDPDATAVESLVVKDSEQMMYKVLVEVYSSDSYTDSPTKHMENSPLANMDGTFLNW